MSFSLLQFGVGLVVAFGLGYVVGHSVGWDSGHDTGYARSMVDGFREKYGPRRER